MELPALVDFISDVLASEQKTFGGGRTSDTNPLVNVMTDKPLQFAAGVPIKEVVERVIDVVVFMIQTEDNTSTREEFLDLLRKEFCT